MAECLGFARPSRLGRGRVSRRDAVVSATAGALTTLIKAHSTREERRPFSLPPPPADVCSSSPRRPARPGAPQACRLGCQSRSLSPSTGSCCSPHQQSLQIPPPRHLRYLNRSSPGLPTVSPKIPPNPYFLSSGPRFTLIYRLRDTALQISHKPWRGRREAQR